MSRQERSPPVWPAPLFLIKRNKALRYWTDLSLRSRSLSMEREDRKGGRCILIQDRLNSMRSLRRSLAVLSICFPGGSVESDFLWPEAFDSPIARPQKGKCAK